MSDTARKVFTMEAALALVLGKEDENIKEMAGYLTGRSLTCCCCAKVVAPMAAGWLANLYPSFTGLTWDENTPWETFVANFKKEAGDNVSLTPMPARLQAMVNTVLDCAADGHASLKAQADEIAKLNAQVLALSPFEGKAKELAQKCDQLEAKVKSLNADIGGLRKELMPFQGKMPVDQQELNTIIKDAIKTNMKGLIVGAGVAGAVAGAEGGDAVAEAVEEEKSGVPDSFGFGASGSDGDGFGF